MAVGNPITLAGVNNYAGSLVVTLWSTLDSLKNFNAWLADSAHDNTFLGGLGMTAGADQTLIRAAIGDLGSPTVGLHSVAHGVHVPASNNDFFFNAKNLSGVTFAG